MYEAGVVDIVDPVTNEVVDQCFGPTVESRCSRADRDGVVLCSGCRVAGRSEGPELWHLWVPAESRHCPQAWNLASLGY